MNVSISLRDRVLASAAATPSLTRRQGRRLAAVLLAVSLAVGLAVSALLARLEPGRAPPCDAVHLADGVALASAILTWLVVGRGGATLARSPRTLAVATLALPVFLFVWMRGFLGEYAEPTLRHDLHCLLATFLAGITPLASYVVLRVRVEPLHRETLGAAAGAMCGAWSTVPLAGCCPVVSGLHVVVGHVVPVALLIFVGAVLGARREAMRLPGRVWVALAAIAASAGSYPAEQAPTDGRLIVPGGSVTSLDASG